MSSIQELDIEVKTAVGRTIIDAAYIDPLEGENWGDHGEYRLTLDDGRVLVFDSIGYDGSDVCLRIEEK